MLIEIDHHIGIPIYRQVIRQIRQQIMTGLLKEGEQLETVRDLAARLKVNPMTISKAYSSLEAEGLLERRRGIGLFVVGLKKEKREQLKDELLSAVLERAAITAIQLDVSEEKALKFFRQLYQSYNSKDGGET